MGDGLGHVRKRGKKWVYVISLGWNDSTKRYAYKWSRGYATKKEANKALVAELKARDDGTHVEPSKETFRKYALAWLTRKAGKVRPSTADGYRVILNAHLLAPFVVKEEREDGKQVDVEHCLRDIKITDISHNHIGLYLQGKEQAGLSARTILHHYRLVSQIFSSAMQKGDIKVNPMARLGSEEIPSPDDVEMNTVGEDELGAFINAFNESRLQPLVILGIQTGLDRGELLGLKWDCVDLTEKPSIRVERTLKQARGEQPTLMPPKTKKRRRRISISSFSVATLNKLKAQQASEKLSAGQGYDDQGFVFANPIGDPLRPATVSHQFRRTADKAGFTNIRLHDLRHTSASLMLLQNQNPKVVQARLGHKNIGITMDTYSHLIHEFDRDASDELDALLEREQGGPDSGAET